MGKHLLENFISEKFKLYHHNYTDVKNAEVKFYKSNGKILKMFLKLKDQWLITCGDTPQRAKTLEEVYEFIKTLDCENVVEAGIGVGKILDYLPSINKEYTIVELNKNLYNMYYNSCNIINDNIFDYIKSNYFEKTIFIIRLTTMGFDSLEEYERYLKQNFGHISNNNYLCFECREVPFEVPNVIKVFTTEITNNKTYIVKL